MLTIKLEINGRCIRQIDVVNTLLNDYRKLSLYRAHCYNFENQEISELLDVEHTRKDGVLKLVEVVAKELNEEIKDETNTIM